jgi:hypothetical protein
LLSDALGFALSGIDLFNFIKLLLMKNLFFLLALSCTLLIGCSEDSITSSGIDNTVLDTRGVTHFSDSGNHPFPHTVTNGCNGELVDLDGIVHWRSWGTITGGTFHHHYHQNFSGIVGIGQTTGTVYNCVGTQNGSAQGKVGVAYSFTVVQNLISTGDGPTFKIKFDQHYTVDANGNVHAEKDNFVPTCH